MNLIQRGKILLDPKSKDLFLFPNKEKVLAFVERKTNIGSELRHRVTGDVVFLPAQPPSTGMKKMSLAGDNEPNFEVSRYLGTYTDSVGNTKSITPEEYINLRNSTIEKKDAGYTYYDTSSGDFYYNTSGVGGEMPRIMRVDGSHGSFPIKSWENLLDLFK